MNSPSNTELIETPIRHFSPSPNNSQELTLELPYVQYVQNQVISIAISLQKEKAQIQTKAMQKQQFYLARLSEQQSKITSLLALNDELQSQIANLKLTSNQSLRYLKRYQLKLQLLVNKISHFEKLVGEKQAIIKYLENKSQQISREGPKSSKHNESIVGIDEINSFRVNQLSFAKMKQSPSLTFQSFKQAATHNTPKELKLIQDFNPRERRIRTESNDFKDSYPKQNLKSSQNKLQDLLTSKQWNNEKTLTKNKSNMSTSCFWKHGNLKLGDTLNKSINTSSNFLPECLYDRNYRESYSKR